MTESRNARRVRATRGGAVPLGLLALVLLLAAAAVSPLAARAAEPSVTAARGSDATVASVQWTGYPGGDFDYYRFTVCPEASFTAGSCQTSVFTSPAYFDADSTGPVSVTGLEADSAYGVVLEVWLRGRDSAIESTTIIPAQPAISFGGSTVADQSYEEGAAIAALTLPQAAGGAGTLTYSLSPALPAGLSFDASSRTIAGTPTVAGAASAYTYSATDGTDTATLGFSIRVAAAGAAEAASAGAGSTPDARPPAAPSSVTVTRSDGALSASWPAVDGASSYHVTYSADGGASWSLAALNHPGSSITISGVDNAETYIVGVRARGDGGDSGWLNSPPAGPYIPPKAPAAPSSVTVTRTDGALGAIWPAVEGATGYHVTYTSDGGASWSLAALSHPGASITISGADNAKTYTVAVRARGAGGDSGWTNSPAAGPYTPPAAGLSFGDAGIADQSYVADTAIDVLTLPAATRSDDGASTTVGATTYSLSPALPAGLSFDAVARTISGTPTGAAASAVYTYTAAYGEDTAALSFSIEVLTAEGVRVASTCQLNFTGTTPNRTFTRNTAASITLPTANFTGATYSVSNLPAGLSFNKNSRVVSGTPTAVESKTVTYQASNPHGDCARRTFKITVNTALKFNSTPAVANRVYGKTLSYITSLPLATGITGNPPIDYTLTPALPAGLSFTTSGNSPAISGTATTKTAEATYTYTATSRTDSTDTVSVTFTIEVRDLPPKPSKPTASRHRTELHSMNTSWTAVTADGGVTSYEVRYRTRDYSDKQTAVLGSWSSVTGIGASATSKKITSLDGGVNHVKPKTINNGTIEVNPQHGRDYDFSVRAVSEAGAGPWSDHVTTRTSGSIDAWFSQKSPVTLSIAENASGNTNVGAAVKANKGEAERPKGEARHCIAGTDAGKFSVGHKTGQVTVKSGTSLDFESKDEYSIEIWASDLLSSSTGVLDSPANQRCTSAIVEDDRISVTIKVTDVDEPPPAPGAPTLATVSNDFSKLNVSWTAPDMTGKPAITDYDVQYRVSGDAQWTSHAHTGTGLSATLTGLKGQTTYEVQVRATNAEGTGEWSDSGTKKTGGNNEPSFSADTATLSVAENSAGGTGVGTVSATDADSDTLTYSLTGGTDKDSFTIGASTGQISTASTLSLDYEDTSSYSVTVGVRDSKDANRNADTAVDDTIAVTINVTDVTEKPSAPSAPAVSQDSADPKTKLNVSWSAPTNTGPAITKYDVQYRKKGASDWTALFNTGTNTSNSLAELKAGSTWQFQVRATSDEGTSDWSATGEGKTETTNTHPQLPDTETFSVNENVAAGTAIGTIAATGDKEDDTLHYAISGTDASSLGFNTSTGAITVKAGSIPDYETKSSYSVSVTVSDRKDDDGNADTAVDDTVAVTINVTDLSYRPKKVTGVGVSPKSSSPNNTLVVSWTAPDDSDPDYDTLAKYFITWMKETDTDWTNDASYRFIDAYSGGSLVTSLEVSGLDVDTTYQFRMKARDDEDLYSEDFSDIAKGSTVSNLDPSFPSSAATRSVAENSGAGTNVGAAVAATDPYPAGDALTYTLTGTDAGKFEVASTTGQITVKSGTTLDYESGTTSYSVTVNVTDKKDSDGTADTAIDDTIAVTISVTDVSEPPAKPAAPTVTANSTTPTSKLDVSWTAPTMTGKPAITDYDVQYRLAGGSTWTSHPFTGTGTGTTITGLAAGKTYEVQVRAANAEGTGGWSNSGTAITTAGGVTRSVAENSAAGTSVGAAVTARANASYTYTHSLGGTDASSFTIESSSGQIKVKSGTGLDYETKSSYSVIVTVTAASAGAQSESLDPNAPGNYKVPVTITVTDVNEVPEFPGAAATRSVAENSAEGTGVGAAVTATDPEDDALTYSLTGTDAGKFEIGSATGQITVKSGTSLDHEAKASYSVTVNVTDKRKADGTADAAIDDTIAVTISVTDADEPPAAPAAPTVGANSATPASKIDASWTAPAMTGRPAISDYDVRYRKTGDST